MMKREKSQTASKGLFRKLIPDIAAVLGALLVTMGTTMIYIPAGFITAGAFILATVFILSR